ncbi:hypothetical protein N9A28_09340 [Sulfurimonas sp.]|nr:hypothetical protein [Sulfurimonas sp.]
MKQKLYEEFLPHLAKDKGILFLSNNHLDIFETVKKEFSSAVQRNITPSALEHLSNTLIHSKIDVVIMDADMDNEMLVHFVEKIKSYDLSMNMILIYDEKNVKQFLHVVDDFSIIIERNKCSKILIEKLFMILSVSFTLEKLSIETKHISKENNIAGMGDMDEFLDTYEGVALFSIEDLSSICTKLRSGELSEELITESSNKLKDISNIFENHDRMRSIAPILQTLSLFLDSLDISTLEPSSLKGFDYLSAILDDVSGALLNMFVDRIYTNVYIIEHSLESNIDFMKNSLLGIASESCSELDFF